MPTHDEVEQLLLDKIAENVQANNVLRVLRYAEAWAWLVSPNQPHGVTKGSKG